MARLDIQFNLRVPVELKDKVEAAAKESGRSINAEAVYRLENSFVEKQPAGLPKKQIMLGTYSPPSSTVSYAEMLELSRKWINSFFNENPNYDLINIETQQNGVIFWYSSPD